MKKLLVILLVFFLFTGCGASEYMVEFNSNGGSLVEEQLVEKGSKATKPVDPTKEGYNFQYWESNNKKYDFNSNVKENLILEAKWEAVSIKTYKVKFNNDGSIKEEEVTEGSSIPEPSIPNKNGHIFLGWYEKEQSEPYNFEKIVNSDIELEAKYQKKDVASSSSQLEETIFVTNLELKLEKEEIERKETTKLDVIIEPRNATDKTLKFSTSNAKIATVDQDGVIKGLKEGEVTITVSTEDSSNIKEKIILNVRKKIDGKADNDIQDD